MLPDVPWSRTRHPSSLDRIQSADGMKKKKTMQCSAVVYHKS